MKIIYTSLLYKILAILIVLIVASSCLDQQVGIESPESRITEFTFRPTLDVSLESKSIGDASRVNQLKVGVFQEDETGLRFIDLHTKLWSQVLEEGVNIELSSDNSYQLLFWLEDSDNSAYYINKDGTVKVNYADYISSGFAKMEELDVFYATTTISSVQTEKQQKIVLTRPVAQLNFADQRKPEMGIHKAKVTLHSFPNSFDPFTGKVNMTDPVDESDDVTFTFVDFPTETFIYNGKEYHYVSCNYILAPTDDIADVECTVELLKNGQTVAHYEFNGNKSIVIEPRKKVNMLDYMVPEPEKWSEWNGKFPTISTLSLDPDNQDCYLIDDAEDIAFLSNREKVAELGEGKTFKLMANIDMGYKPNQSSMKLPARSTFDGNGFTIKGVKMMAGLFGDVATNLTLRNLTVVDAFVTSTTNSHKGIIANTLSGSSSITNVSYQTSCCSIHCNDR